MRYEAIVAISSALMTSRTILGPSVALRASWRNWRALQTLAGCGLTDFRGLFHSNLL